MARAMRRSLQEVTDSATLESWLREAIVGRLATVDADGYPVIKPVNFVYHEGTIYFHCAREGEKLDDIHRDGRVTFEVDEVYAITPPVTRGCQVHCLYHSLIVWGLARILDDAGEREEKEKALQALIEKYAVPYEQGRTGMREKDIRDTAVVAIMPERMSGKEDLGQHWTSERKLEVARLLYRRDGEKSLPVIARMGLSAEEVKRDA